MKRASSLIFQAIFAAAALLAAPVIHAQSTPALQNIYGRSHVSLNGRWHYLVDPYETGFYDYLRNAFDEQPNGSRLLRRPQTEGQGRQGRIQLRPGADDENTGRLEFAGRKAAALRRHGLAAAEVQRHAEGRQEVLAVFRQGRGRSNGYVARYTRFS